MSDGVSAEPRDGRDNLGMALNEWSGRGHARAAKDRASRHKECFHNVAHEWA